MTVPAEVLRELAPTGTLRVGINLGNGVLAQGTPEAPRGVTADLTHELARRTGLPLQIVTYPSAGKLFEALTAGAWDVGYMANEPVRAAEIEFSPPYVLIEGTYMVPKTSQLKVIEDVDKPGIRIAVGKGSAYDLYLTRTIRHATIVRSEIGGGAAMIELFLSDKLECTAGVRQPLVAYAATDPNVRVMDGRFMEILQSVAVPKGRLKAAAYVRQFIEQMKASGFVAAALKRSGQEDAAVAPPARD